MCIETTKALAEIFARRRIHSNPDAAFVAAVNFSLMPDAARQSVIDLLSKDDAAAVPTSTAINSATAAAPNVEPTKVATPSVSDKSSAVNYPEHYTEAVRQWLSGFTGDFIVKTILPLFQKDYGNGKGLFDDNRWTILPAGRSYLDLTADQIAVLDASIQAPGSRFVEHVSDRYTKFNAAKNAA